MLARIARQDKSSTLHYLAIPYYYPEVVIFLQHEHQPCRPSVSLSTIHHRLPDLDQRHLPQCFYAGRAGNWAQQGTNLEFSTPPFRSSALQSIQELRNPGYGNQQDAPFSMQPAPSIHPSTGGGAAGSRPGTPFKDFFNQLLNERVPQVCLMQVILTP